MDSVNKISINNVNVCRCCLADGCYKDICTEYYHSGQREVYDELLKKTFDIQIPFTNDGETNTKSCLICDSCIIRLRDASGFKEMVEQSLRAFTDFLEKTLNNCTEDSTNETLQFEIKQEVLIDTNMKYDEEINHYEEIDDCDSSEKMPKLEKNRFKTRGQVVSKKKRVADKLTNKSKPENDWVKIAERRGNGPLLRENSIKLISNSTICVFQWNKSRYRCFCCMEPYSDLNLLRDHTNSSHTLEEIKKKIIVQQNRLVKVEVSMIYCNICGTKLDNLDSLKCHLMTHGLRFELDEHLLVPFKINSESLQCQICNQKFSTFRLLNIHMNKYYQKQVCHICGAGFSNLVFLNLHKSRSHRQLSCKECNLNFKDRTEKREHDITAHNLKTVKKLRFPCPYCQQRFCQENFRVQHLVEAHGMAKPEHKCGLCSKVFITRSLCNNHVKKVHLKEKNHSCDICHHLFYTKSDVERHKITHTGDKKFSCTVCSNIFSTKDSLRRHVKRAHAGI